MLYLLVLLFFSTASAVPKPVTAPYIKPCATSQPDFEECALRHGKEALPDLVKGDKKHKIQSLDPLEILELKVEDGPSKGITFVLKDAKVTGFKDSILMKTVVSKDLKRLDLAFTVPRLMILGKYDVSGRLLVLPITGHGDINSTTVEANITIGIDLLKEQRDGKEYLKLENPILKMVPKRVYVTLTNLFNGNELLGREMNNFIDKNWEEVNKEISPPVEEAIAQIAITNINKLFKTSQFKDIFPETLPQ